MTQQELNYLKEYPQASKASLVLDYLFIEDDQGNILEQCFIPKSGAKSCYLPVVQEQNKSKVKSSNKPAGVYNSSSNTIPLSPPTSWKK
jgi:hypothetical protein